MPDIASRMFSELGFVFISIPKTATNSIWDVILPTPEYKPFQHVQGKVIKYFMDHFAPGCWESCYRFTCVHHPYDLTRSWYQYHTTHPDISQEVKDFYDFSFEEWANDYDFMTHWELEKQKSLNPLWDGSNPLYQWRWIYDDAGNMLVNEVINQESLEDGLKSISKTIPLNRGLKKLNTSGDTNTIKLSDKTKSSIYSKFKKDFELFGFEEG